ncbi:hypothetical protein L6205_19425 [Pseudomonas syringae pv. syringae]|uniref:hypothetical protein n=1 Tax=Pseudomonas syringae TaxID=317 RepID=UPI001F0CF295|nr:hypothetical protein [Pseudomonas syringae]MCH5531315.1 hypothetical protein [Pseudomonas syringae pv. syringae]MCH5541376.1 hypothetical protein [Pseudomonas syringae pv. syringae]MCH5546390.1 hypothetical protein [Pseudomonas syringae pv. syringae]MCH5604751.1 hypothetical protein [Pseudomonas syringae pv. syringae]MCH5609637.1 hypothetical protein [Pseudomonas syringae pv. syringae]
MYFAVRNYTNRECTIPWAAIAPNILIDKNAPDYPFLNGTGFFCRLADGVRYYYVTALHCLEQGGYSGEIEDFPLLKVAYETSLKSPIVSEDVRFEGFINVAHGDKNKPGAHEDALVYMVEADLTSKQEETLRRRALVINNPQWYKSFFEKISLRTKLRVIGYPKDSTTEAEILDGKARTQRRFLWGYYSNDAHYLDRKALDKLNWKGTDLIGFSGAPVLTQEYRLLGIQSIPVGIVLTGNSRRLEFLDMGRIADMILYLERYGLDSKVPFRYSY